MDEIKAHENDTEALAQRLQLLYSKRYENVGDSRTFKADRPINICMNFMTFWSKWFFWRGVKIGEGLRDVDPNELFITFGSFYVCASFGENRSRNTTVRVRTDGQADAQRPSGFIISPMQRYAIAVGQIIKKLNIKPNNKSIHT